MSSKPIVSVKPEGDQVGPWGTMGARGGPRGPREFKGDQEGPRGTMGDQGGPRRTKWDQGVPKGTKGFHRESLGPRRTRQNQDAHVANNDGEYWREVCEKFGVHFGREFWA